PDTTAFTEALTEWKVDQSLVARDAKATESQARTEQQSQNREFLEREAAFADTLPPDPKEGEGYDEVADAALGMLGQLNTPATKEVARAVMASENGPELLYHLGQNPDELQRIAKLKPQAAVMALGGIAASLADTEEKGTEVETQTPLVSRAPKPPTRVKKPAGGRKAKADDPETHHLMSDDDWDKARDAEEAKAP
ncbi:hypothetical protein LCGC14_1776910, partial [marine sediment metagenome]